MNHQSNRSEAAASPGRPGKRLPRGFVTVGVIGLLVAGVAATSQSNSTPDATEVVLQPVTPKRLSVAVTRIGQARSYQVAREYTGTIVARRVSELSFERVGLLETVRVEEGNSVADGAELAILDSENLRTKRREVVARRAQAQASLDEMIAGPRREDIDAARAAVASLAAEVELLKIRAGRSHKLLLRQAATQDEHDEYQFNYEARRGQLGRARYELEELENGTRQEQLDAQQALVEQLDAAIEEIDVDLRKSRLTAPFAGTVSRRLADEGTVIGTGQAILTIVEDKALEVWVGLPVDATRKMKTGSRRAVRISGDVLEARVTGLRPEVDPATRTRTIILGLDDSASQTVVHGQIVRLQLQETVNASGFWLPVTALTAGDRGLWSCLVAVPGDSTGGAPFRLERRDVEVLHTESDRVFARGTLNSGDRVVTRGTHRVTSGQAVDVKSPSDIRK